jgi:hypothetical protein
MLRKGWADCGIQFRSGHLQVLLSIGVGVRSRKWRAARDHLVSKAAQRVQVGLDSRRAAFSQISGAMYANVPQPTKVGSAVPMLSSRAMPKSASSHLPSAYRTFPGLRSR